MSYFSDSANASTCSEYKQYYDRYFEQHKQLKNYEVDDFKTNAEDDSTMLDQLSVYLDKLEPYCRHLSTFSNLRQVHYESHIRGKFIECPKHTNARITFNRLAEDANDKLEYWQEFKDRLFSRLVKEDEARKIIEDKRTWAHIDQAAENVDYNAKIVSRFIVRKPVLSKVERKKNQKARKAARALASKAELKLIHSAIQTGDIMRRIAKEEFVADGGVMVEDLISDMINNPGVKSDAFEKAYLHPNRKHPGSKIIFCFGYTDAEKSENITKLATMYFEQRKLTWLYTVSHFSYAVANKDFRKAYIEISHTDSESSPLEDEEDSEFVEDSGSNIIMDIGASINKNLTVPVDGRKRLLLVLAGKLSDEDKDIYEIQALKKHFVKKYNKDAKTRRSICNFLNMLNDLKGTALIYSRASYLSYIASRIRIHLKLPYFSQSDNILKVMKVDMDSFDGRLIHFTREEQMIYVDSDVMKFFMKSRRTVCELAGVSEQQFIDADMHDKKFEGCDNPNCKNCHKVCHCVVCHTKI